MSYILVNNSSKGGPCCSRSIDLELGCRNNCIGGYCFKTSLRGKKFHTEIIYKEYDDKKFRNSIKKSISQGFNVARLGKHSDPGAKESSKKLRDTIKACSEENFKVILVSKSLTYDKELSELLQDNTVTLHISLGMKTNAPSNEERLSVFESYLKDNVNAKLRITDDITKPLGIIYDYIKKYYLKETIITPMRFSSKEMLSEYNADINNYEWISGYYRPKSMHSSWDAFNHICGEINNKTKCCNCLISN